MNKGNKSNSTNVACARSRQLIEVTCGGIQTSANAFLHVGVVWRKFYFLSEGASARVAMSGAQCLISVERSDRRCRALCLLSSLHRTGHITLRSSQACQHQ